MEKNKKITIHQIFWYFVIFSILGLIIETTYGYATMGILESRKGLLWGPFCPVYGVGATLLVLLLNNVDQRNYFKLFLYGFLIGSVVEYMLSYGLEAIFGTRFWDYAYTGKDINGRICTLYSLFWGILAILLMKLIKPIIDKIINKIPNKIKIPTEATLTTFLLIDVLVTIWAIYTYENRAIKQYYQEQLQQPQTNKASSNIIYQIENKYFTNERMKNTFPNLRTKNKEGQEIWVRDIIK